MHVMHCHLSVLLDQRLRSGFADALAALRRRSRALCPCVCRQNQLQALQTQALARVLANRAR